MVGKGIIVRIEKDAESCCSENARKDVQKYFSILIREFSMCAIAHNIRYSKLNINDMS